MKQANLDIRQAAKVAKIPLWRIAALLPMNDAAFSRKLRFELSSREKIRIFDIIEELKEEADREQEAL